MGSSIDRIARDFPKGIGMAGRWMATARMVWGRSREIARDEVVAMVWALGSLGEARNNLCTCFCLISHDGLTKVFLTC
jgi:hypothetical protein